MWAQHRYVLVIEPMKSSSYIVTYKQFYFYETLKKEAKLFDVIKLTNLQHKTQTALLKNSFTVSGTQVMNTSNSRFQLH